MRSVADQFSLPAGAWSAKVVVVVVATATAVAATIATTTTTTAVHWLRTLSSVWALTGSDWEIDKQMHTHTHK